MASLIVPGLGQILMGEVDRGVTFFMGTAIAAVVLGVIGALIPVVLSVTSGNPAVSLLTVLIGPLGLVTGLSGGLAWSTIDAYCLDAEQHGWRPFGSPASSP